VQRRKNKRNKGVMLNKVNLKGFVHMVEKCKEEFLKFEHPSRVIKKSAKARDAKTEATPPLVKLNERKATPTKHKGGPRARRREKR
jgi:hypothetical protein